MKQQWDDLYAAWLAQAGKNPHTARSYQTATQAWFAHLRGWGVAPWAAQESNALAWKEHLQSMVLAAATINHRLVVCQALYRFVGEYMPLDHGNPFQAIKPLPASRQTQDGPPFLWVNETDQLIRYLEDRCHTLTGKRNYALILGYLLTGYRSHELISLRWGEIRPHRQQRGTWIIERGTGRARTVDPLPERVYEAIVDYLIKAGRDPGTMGAEEYIFLPIVTHQLKNLPNQPERADNQPISAQQVAAILKLAFCRAGITRRLPRQIVTLLRATFSHRFYRNTKNAAALRVRLHHKNTAYTQAYVKATFPNDPVDDFSETIYKSLVE